MGFTKNRLGHDFRYSLNSEKARNQFESRASIDFEDEIMKTMRSYMGKMAWVSSKVQFLRKLEAPFHQDKHDLLKPTKGRN